MYVIAIIAMSSFTLNLHLLSNIMSYVFLSLDPHIWRCYQSSASNRASGILQRLGRPLGKRMCVNIAIGRTRFHSTIVLSELCLKLLVTDYCCH